MRRLIAAAAICIILISGCARHAQPPVQTPLPGMSKAPSAIAPPAQQQYATAPPAILPPSPGWWMPDMPNGKKDLTPAICENVRAHAGKLLRELKKLRAFPEVSALLEDTFLVFGVWTHGLSPNGEENLEFLKTCHLGEQKKNDSVARIGFAGARATNSIDGNPHCFVKEGKVLLRAYIGGNDTLELITFLHEMHHFRSRRADPSAEVDAYRFELRLLDKVTAGGFNNLVERALSAPRREFTPRDLLGYDFSELFPGIAPHQVPGLRFTMAMAIGMKLIDREFNTSEERQARYRILFENLNRAARPQLSLGPPYF